MGQDSTIADLGAHPAIAALHGDAMLRDAVVYWNGLRQGRLVPARSEIDPGALSDLLGHAAMLERPRPGTIRFRLAGGRISALMGLEARGMPFRTLFDLDQRPRVTKEVEASFDTVSLLFGSLIPRDAPPGERPETHMVLMPLSDTSGAVTRALFLLGEGACRTVPSVPCRWRVTHTLHVPLRPGVSVMPGRPAPLPPTARQFRVIQGGLA
ncbi:PAS domain-containing protein [Maritalea mobilis]|uniref:PAS domain-containing protein n=1 Tax=Maritalea mobilis TaxID=483324 RepID=UPI001C97C90A|nr:PAS domain-containing protein [Maritalea mobilis]MBY6200115.1 PAS domain-containing protein [Maritalea mobilis]